MAKPTPLGIGGFPAGTESGFRTEKTPPTLRPRTLHIRAIAARPNRSSLVLVRRGAAEVSMAFWTTLVGLSGRRPDLVGEHAYRKVRKQPTKPSPTGITGLHKATALEHPLASNPDLRNPAKAHAGCTSSQAEAGADTFPHGGPNAYEPFPNLSRGF